MWRMAIAVCAGLVVVAAADQGAASDRQDWADCAALDRPTSVAACTRIIVRSNISQVKLAAAYYNRGRANRAAGDKAQAMADFDISLKLNPRHADTYFYRAMAHLDGYDVDPALSDFGSYLSLKPDDWIAYYARGRLWRIKGEPDQAIADYDRAAAFNPNNQQVMLMRGLAWGDKGEHARSTADLNRVLAINPRNAEALYARAVVAFRAQQYSAAIVDLDKALAIERGFTAAQTLYGRVLEAQGQSNLARARYQAAIAGPLKLIDSQSAQSKARERLAALLGQPPRDGGEQSGGTKAGCSRYLPTAATTISIDCAD
jgi:tetratricopeptide (TPR) repeat protein